MCTNEPVGTKKLFIGGKVGSIGAETSKVFFEIDRMHGGLRSVRSVARSVDRVDRFGRFGIFATNFADFFIFSPSRGARDLSGVKV